MKTNAIIRIITWSLIVIILLGILTAGLGFRGISLRWRWDDDDVPAATAIPQRIEPTEANVYLKTTFYAEKSINIHSKPSDQAEIKHIIEAGDSVHLTRDEMVNGHHWGYVTEPEQGWILLEDASDASATVPTEPLPSSDAPIATDPSAPTANAANVNGYGVNANEIAEISIEWAAGAIRIVPIEGNRITVEETGATDRYPMVVKQKNNKLSIAFNEKKTLIGISLDFSKDLTIGVPKYYLLQELDIDAASATVLVQDLTIREVEFDGASGACEFVNCSINSLDIDTASGDVLFTGSLKELDCDAASASFTGQLTNVPHRMEMDSMSGNLDITLPENAGFTVSMEGLKSDFSSDFETINRNGTYVHGDGTCRIQMEAMSGDVMIRKAK